ncbi:MAG TPA: c-type cytochrome [Candidatus Acidoferrum sp.]|nr:c-type cytochrome [Candidatus Acidoferrum sp.]
MCAAAFAALAQDTRESVDEEMSKPMIRGGIVFKNYCVLCHGERGDGVARAAKLYAGINLAIRPRTLGYYNKIVRKGGEAVGASPSMPPWQDELSNEQVGDVLSYLTVLGDPVRRGEVIFKTNCVLCHGLKGDGKGRAAKLYNPPPTDLTRSGKSDEYREKIIRHGGESMRRSSGMPPWQERLSNSEIADLMAYLHRLSQPVR